MVRFNEDSDNRNYQHQQQDHQNLDGVREDVSEGMSEFSSLRHLRSSLCADRDRLFGDHQVHQAVEEWRAFFGRIAP